VPGQRRDHRWHPRRAYLTIRAAAFELWERPAARARRSAVLSGNRVYQAICKLTGIAVNAAGIPPDRISFPHALAAATDTVAAFSP
jgi:hypothetical protein